MPRGVRGRQLCSIEGCEKPCVGRGWCRYHWDRWKRTGGPLGSTRPSLADRFWSKVDKSGGPDACWPWTAHRNRAGYGVFQMGGHNGRPHIASRVALGLTQGAPLAAGTQANHHCDNPPCCNPRHLYVGTKAENAEDARNRGQLVVGAQHPLSKLDDDKVREIRRLIDTGVTDGEIGSRFGINRQMVAKIRTGKSWKHVA